MDTYPRFTVTRAVKFSAEPERIAYRVSKKRADALAFGFWPETRLHIALPPRFRITIAKYPTSDPFILHDASRPAFRGQHRTLDLACVAMDNIIRRERRMPSRIGGLRETTERYLEAKARERHPRRGAQAEARLGVEIAHHVGQHTQGCRACYAYAEGRVAGGER